MFNEEATQTEITMQQKALNERVVKEGMQLWKKQKEFENARKMKEQKEMRDMLEKYWPWSTSNNVKPRGYKNLRLEELFPNRDYENAKRFVGLLELGKPGGGAPMANNIKTKEDPMLRFQFGSKDLRRYVDNNFRYKTNKNEQQLYKQQLDQLVQEKHLRNKQEKERSDKSVRKQGWSTEETLANLEEKSRQFKEDTHKNYENFKKMNLVPPNKVIKLDYSRKPRRLSPLSHDKDHGVELVTLLARDRKYPPKIPLATTDITSEKKLGRTTIWNREGSAYLKELTNQMSHKQQKLKEMKAEENETVQRHFSTWDGFWGRPGNGAPRDEIKKQCLDQLLYPKFIPITVN